METFIKEQVQAYSWILSLWMFFHDKNMYSFSVYKDNL